MTNAESIAIRNLINGMSLPVDEQRMAREEAFRIIVRFGLCHPITLSAALKIVASEFPHGRVAEIERTARALHAKLSKRDAKVPMRS